MSLPDISNLNLAELIELEGQIKARAEKIRREARSALRQEFIQKAAANGMTLDEVMGVVTAGRKSPAGAGVAKYANPANPEQTWTGRGRKPEWVIAHLSNGGSLDDLAI